MELWVVFLAAVGLSFDTFAVSVSNGIVMNRIVFLQAVRIALVMAVVQGLMPLIGWLVGNGLSGIFATFDHWIAFGLLVFIGGKMFWEGLGNEQPDMSKNPLNFKILILSSVATSIDALALGLTLSFFKTALPISLGIIFFVTFAVAMFGMLIGKKLGARAGKRMELLGGLILAGLGVKILLEHLWLA